jgi:hypothetical protein
MEYDPADELEQRGVGVKQPDRIFGLNQTEVLRDLTRARRSIKHSPFKDGEVLYPFLLLEAKSENSSPGFQSVERTSAFPIRTLLKLQRDLATDSALELNPFVWFLANQGPEWRVYACILDGEKYVCCLA